VSLLTHLENLAGDALLRGREREKNRLSAQALEERLAEHFQDQITDAFAYGSSIRGTSLPQYYSESIDIDYLVVFQNDGRTPLTYLKRLLDFAHTHYKRSLVCQSTPAVCIRMAHVSFELVPALPAFFNDYKIPTSQGEWKGANPRGLKETLSQRNQECGGMLKPAVRLAKLWNTHAGHVFGSFDLETQATTFDYGGARNVRDHFLVILRSVSLGFFSDAATWRKSALQRAREVAMEALALEAKGDPRRAIATINKLFP
jgi:hypothetical protein